MNRLPKCVAAGTVLVVVGVVLVTYFLDREEIAADIAERAKSKTYAQQYGK